MIDPDDCPCPIHAETGSCPHGSAVKVRLGAVWIGMWKDAQ